MGMPHVEAKYGLIRPMQGTALTTEELWALGC